jgi:hypothetical protein
MAIDSEVGTSTFFLSRTNYFRPGMSPPSFPIYYNYVDQASSLRRAWRLRAWRLRAILEE